jgi:hypothetical protein
LGTLAKNAGVGDAHAATAVPPDVRFGCIPENLVPGADCQERGDSALGRWRQQMQLAVGRPSSEWVSWIAGVMNDQRTARTLVVTLEVGQTPCGRRDCAGRRSSSWARTIARRCRGSRRWKRR